MGEALHGGVAATGLQAVGGVKPAPPGLGVPRCKNAPSHVKYADRPAAVRPVPAGAKAQENPPVTYLFAPLPRASLYLTVALLAMTAGCAARKPVSPLLGPRAGVAVDRTDAKAEAVRADPLAYLREVLENCRDLEQYTVDFTRQERRGLWLKNLRAPEHIACKFRREPFSIYMKWTDPDIKYGESTYVAGQENDQVRFVPRHGLFGLPPAVTRVDLETPVTWGEARYPLTDFGLERMMERTMANVARAGDDVSISYRGLTTLAESDRVAHFLKLEFPPALFRTPVQELFIDVETDLPTCTRVLYESGELEAAYVWENVDPGARFTDEDFLLDAERGPVASPPQTAADEEDG